MIIHATSMAHMGDKKKAKYVKKEIRYTDRQEAILSGEVVDGFCKYDVLRIRKKAAMLNDQESLKTIEHMSETFLADSEPLLLISKAEAIARLNALALGSNV